MRGDKRPFLQFNALDHGEFKESVVSAGVCYRPEIDGLRGVAVLGVLLFHLESAWLPGGFVGVDVFFVISGYLITSILVRNQADFSFLRFYQRRIARLFPALIVMLLVTLLLARFFYTSWDYANTAAGFSASVLSIANMHQWMQGDYFALSPDGQPLMHCWSLAVEEQFYLVFPFLLFALMKVSGKIRLAALGVLTLVSFGLGLYWTHAHAPSGFYLLPSRAWELLVGAVLATWHRPHSAARSGWSLCGLLLIVGAYLGLNEAYPFPGWVALIPVAGAAMVVHGGPTFPLTWTPLVRVGRLSYSLYLWHWPVFSFTDYVLIWESPITRFVVKVGVTVLATLLSYHWIERPFRERLNRSAWRPWAYGLLAGSLILLGPLGYAQRKEHYIDGSDGGDRGRVFRAPLGASGKVVLIGDSQGSMYAALLRNLASELDRDLLVLCEAGKDPLVGSELWERSFARIRLEQPEYLVLACHWDKLRSDPSRLERSVSALKPHVGKVILVAMPPDLPKAGTRASIRSGARPPFLEDPNKRSARVEHNSMALALGGDQVAVIDTTPFYVAEDGAVVVYNERKKALFYDGKHLSHVGAKRLEGALRSALGHP